MHTHTQILSHAAKHNTHIHTYTYTHLEQKTRLQTSWWSCGWYAPWGPHAPQNYELCGPSALKAWWTPWPSLGLTPVKFKCVMDSMTEFRADTFNIRKSDGFHDWVQVWHLLNPKEWWTPWLSLGLTPYIFERVMDSLMDSMTEFRADTLNIWKSDRFRDGLHDRVQGWHLNCSNWCKCPGWNGRESIQVGRTMNKDIISAAFRIAQDRGHSKLAHTIDATFCSLK